MRRDEAVTGIQWVRAWRWPLLSGALGLLAFHPLITPPGADSGFREAEHFFFERSGSAAIHLAAAAWLAWRRIGRLQLLQAFPSAEDRSSLGRAIPFWTIGTALFVWAELTEANDLLVPALVAILCGIAVQRHGLRAINVMSLPIVVALLAMPLPGPIYNEVVWSAQRGATIGASLVLKWLGYPIRMGDMAIEHEGHVFWVIETCSGLRALELLTIASLVVRDLLGPNVRRSWLVVLMAPIVALGLNVLRLVVIVAFQSGQASAEDHVVHGLVSVFVGTLLLYLLGHFMLPARSRSSGAPGLVVTAKGAFAMPTRAGWRVSSVLITIFASLSLLSVALPTWPPATSERPSLDEFRESRGGWSAKPSSSPPVFFSEQPVGRVVATRFERSSPDRPEIDAVELRVLAEALDIERSSLRSSMLDGLGPEWSTRFLGTTHTWQIDRKVRTSLVEFAGVRALSYRWVVSSRSWWQSVLDSALALKRIPGWPRDVLVDVRISTQIYGTGSDRDRERAAQVLSAFLADFAIVFRKLEPAGQ
jgi:exosortase